MRPEPRKAVKGNEAYCIWEQYNSRRDLLFEDEEETKNINAY